MIIYPAIIIFLLLVALAIVYRRAYLTEQEFPGELAQEVDTSSGQAQEITELREINPFEGQEENFAKAEELFKKKQYKSAEKWYIEAVKKNPRSSTTFARLGVIYLEQRNFPDAIESFKESLKLNPIQASCAFNLSYAYNSEGDNKEAINAAKRAIRLEPKSKKYKKWLDQLKIQPF